MKNTRVRILIGFFLPGLVNFLVLACSLSALSRGTTPTCSADH